MVLRPTLRRQSRGFTLLLALGVVAVVTMAVMLSLSVVGREADTQADTRRQKQAFFAAEAGLAEGREAVRLLMDKVGSNAFVFQDELGAAVTEPGLGSAADPWYDVLPAPGAPSTDRWNLYQLTTSQLETSEKRAGPGVDTPNQPYTSDYPEQTRVRYRVFVHNDKDGAAAGTDSNHQVWLVSVGEVLSPNGRPTRAVVQTLVVHSQPTTEFTAGCPARGCSGGMTFESKGVNAPVLGSKESL
ncbi:hypothetical protein [Corallococcus caeni]|uniref:Type 4 fimbrial biogenesis protein PilX N-terminal domain-containing protein n=1 Tax=Corallococcus caeni TaxID=3082388 RepID=A0ABQ6QKY3_9BACT|nr:hypothetical protein ASNO1_08960 [Corallococcus sp. NO1]